jgi:LPS-assembly protein
MAAWGTSGANDGDIPNQDAVSFESAEASLFAPNGAANYDLWEGGTRYSAGVRASARWGKNNSIHGVVGRRWRQTADEAFNELTNLSGTRSDLVAGTGLKRGRALSLDTRFRLDEQTLDFKRLDARLGLNFWRIRSTTNYFFVDEKLANGIGGEGVISQISFDVTDNWSFSTAIDRNIEDGLNVRQIYGIGYEDDCTNILLTYERTETVDRQIEPQESINFTFLLKSVGGAGSSQFD